MKISSYSFGHIVIDGVSYDADVIILPGRVMSPWRRQRGHELLPADLDEVVGAAPGFLIVGTGRSGAMKVPAGTIEFMQGRGIQMQVMRTGEAVEAYNREPGPGVAAALHLTC